MKFIHTADIHYGRIFSKSRLGPEFAAMRRREIDATFSRLIDYANEREVDFILCAGDLIDGDNVGTQELKNLNDTISKLKKGKIFCVAGNHDPLISRSVYNKIEWCDKLHIAPAGMSRIVLKEYDATIYAYSWNEKYIKHNPLLNFTLKKDTKHNILLIHADNIQNSEYLPLDIKAVAGMGFDYVALGHVHNPTKISEHIYYPGSLEPLDSSEKGSHGFMLCELDDSINKFNFIPFARRKYFDLEVEVQPDFSEVKITDIIVEKLSELAPSHIANIKLIGTHHAAHGPWDIEKVWQDLKERGFYCEIDDFTKPDFDLEKLKLENEKNIIGEFISSFGDLKELDDIEQMALIYGVRALLQEKGAM